MDPSTNKVGSSATHAACSSTLISHVILCLFVCLPLLSCRLRLPSWSPGLESEQQLKPMSLPILRHPLGAPLIIGPQHLLAQHLINGAGHPSLLSHHQHHDPATAAALFYSRPYDFGAQYAHNLLAATAPHLLEYQTQSSPSDGLATGGLIQLTSR